MENKISVHNLKKNFGKLEVLKDISIEIRAVSYTHLTLPTIA